jgi:3-methyladenine DNA glycosylase AlkD
MTVLSKITAELQKFANPEKGVFLERFFKTGPGQYGEGDVFIGLSAPQLRIISKTFYKDCSLEEISVLLNSPIHEYRLLALFMLTLKYSKAKEEAERKTIADFYILHTKRVNSWDLVDSSADRILGAYLYNKDRGLLFKLAESENLWEQRISIMATFYFIKQGDFQDTLAISEKLLYHKHDLIHKAVGWMLREIGNRDLDVELGFLNTYYKKMPRTMLRYAIEKFQEELRLKYLKGKA